MEVGSTILFHIYIQSRLDAIVALLDSLNRNVLTLATFIQQSHSQPQVQRQSSPLPEYPTPVSPASLFSSSSVTSSSDSLSDLEDTPPKDDLLVCEQVLLRPPSPSSLCEQVPPLQPSSSSLCEATEPKDPPQRTKQARPIVVEAAQDTTGFELRPALPEEEFSSDSDDSVFLVQVSSRKNS